MSRVVGGKGGEGGGIAGEVKARPNQRYALGSVWLDGGRGERNGECGVEMLRYLEERRWRWRLSVPYLTLRLEIVGSEQD